MDLVRGNYPQVGYFIPDGNTMEGRIAFKFRMVSEPFQAYNVVAGGLIDTGTGGVIITSTKLEYKPKAKVIINDVLYSVKSIQPVITDPMTQGLLKKKLLAEYIITLV